MKRMVWGLLAVLGTMSAAGAADGPAEAVPSRKMLGRAFGERDVEAFRSPQKIFYPETWFHFIGGNVARAGLTADLEAIAGAGIEGIQLFHGQFGGPWPGVTNQIQCLSPEWDGLVRFAADECRRLGLRFSMQNCPGWSYAGGPWIAASNAMRQLVWSTVAAEGGKGVQSLALPEPAKPGGDSDYRDIAVIAYRAPEGAAQKPAYPVAFASSRPDFPWDKFFRSQKEGALRCTLGAEPLWVEATFAEPFALRSVEVPSAQQVSHARCYVPDVRIRVEAVLPDGSRRAVLDAKLPQSNWQGNRAVTLACAASEAKTYRVSLTGGQDVNMSHITLSAAPLKNNWEAEAGWVLGGLFEGEKRPALSAQGSASAAETVGEVVDLTGRLAADGRLSWEVPAGRWLVQRWGHSNTGARNGPAPKEGTGWECDKLSKAGADAHFDGYIGRLSGKGGALEGGLLKGLLTDSWECHTQTWTPGLEQAFKRRRGYDLLPWMPALCGYVVGDEERTARFLRDWRSCINDLLVGNFYGRLAERARRNNLALSLETASGDVFPGDLLEYYKHADVPMCEFWQPRSEAFVGSLDFKPIKPCASAARLYGKPRVAAEAFTSFALTWNEHWDMLKDVANIHFAEGVTHLVFHTYTHNPRNDWLPPGTSFGSGIGTPFLRGQTWWRHMPEFSGYLARCGYLLERGRPVSDVLLYLGDEQDHKPPQEMPFPAGFKYDYCNPDILLNRLSVRDGMLVTPEGLRYRVLWLRDCRRMLPETLEKIVALVRKGATVVGDRPQGLATLSGGDKAQKRFDAAVDALWGQDAAAGGGRVGKGRVLSGLALGDALVRLGLDPDVTGEGVMWCHRQTRDAEWYFVAAPAQRGFRGALGFRSLGKVELWDPVSGAATEAGAVTRDGSRSRVALDLPPAGACFVVFRWGKKSGATVARVEREGLPVIDTRADGGVVPLPQVVSARYGDLTKEGRWKDVSELVRAALAKGDAAIRPGNEWAGGDPALGTRKRFDLTLRLADGRETVREAGEGETVPLLEPVPAAPKVCEVVEGGAALVVWEPGRYRVTRTDGAVKERVARDARRVPLSGAWTLSFPKGWGAPESVRVESLASWTELDLPAEAKAFSGTACYTLDFALDALPPGARVELDLGRVEMIAGVRLNGVPVGTVWAAPYRVDVTRAVKPGTNRLAVEVTGTWFNRLVYDAGLPEAERKTWTIKGPDKAASLQPAGLLGPVALRVGQRVDLAE
ncbi:MAG TPA: glycosyl hydrolase [Kiritimatiellia bacterium]|nr:glycosyl hydrolase [Kiritimatiellia bacterium]HPS08680.1 glycosyl hydrolase [Kiritimatiellia bacterium]